MPRCEQNGAATFEVPPTRSPVHLASVDLFHIAAAATLLHRGLWIELFQSLVFDGGQDVSRTRPHQDRTVTRWRNHAVPSVEGAKSLGNVSGATAQKRSTRQTATGICPAGGCRDRW